MTGDGEEGISMLVSVAEATEVGARQGNVSVGVFQNLLF